MAFVLTKKQIRNYGILFFGLIFLLAGSLLFRQEKQEQLRPAVQGPTVKRDWDDISKHDTLVVLVPYNSTTYFLYRGEPLGYEYDLLKNFAKENEVTLRVEVVRDQSLLFHMLNKGEGDIAAARLVPSPDFEQVVSYTEGFYQTEPSLVQKAGSTDSLIDPAKRALATGKDTLDVQAKLIQKPNELKGETVYLPKGSPYRRTLIELEDTMSGDIDVVEIGGTADDEELVRRVSAGEITYTVIQGNVGVLKEAFFTNIRIAPVIGPRHKVSWAVRKNSPQLLQTLNEWLKKNEGSGLFNALYKKYFDDRRTYLERFESDYMTSKTGKLSAYDNLLKKYAPEINWDWRLLGSQMYQESKFKPAARSWAGASGLLQLMPATAREFGVRNMMDPEDNVRGAVKFLSWLTKYWTKKIPDEQERLKFILASYNTGAGHVEDAQRLTEKYGGNPLLWKDVSYWLLQKAKTQYNTDPVVKYGYCRGLEPVTYVQLILDRYAHYKQFVVT